MGAAMSCARSLLSRGKGSTFWGLQPLWDCFGGCRRLSWARHKATQLLTGLRRGEMGALSPRTSCVQVCAPTGTWRVSIRDPHMGEQVQRENPKQRRQHTWPLALGRERCPLWRPQTRSAGIKGHPRSKGGVARGRDPGSAGCRKVNMGVQVAPSPGAHPQESGTGLAGPRLVQITFGQGSQTVSWSGLVSCKVKMGYSG